MSDLVTVTVLIIPFVFTAVVFWIKSNEKLKRRQLQYELYAKSLEKGEHVPADLFETNKKKPEPLHIGIILIAAGIGISLLFCLMAVIYASMNYGASDSLFTVIPVGVLPLSVGVAYLIIHYLEKQKKSVGKA